MEEQAPIDKEVLNQAIKDTEWQIAYHSEHLKKYQELQKIYTNQLNQLIKQMSSNTGLTYKGQVVFIGETEVISDKFSKRLIVLSDKSSEYPQEIAFELHKGNCDKANGLTIGDEAIASYNLNGKLWKDNKWFNTLVIWKLESVGGSNSQAPKHSNIVESDDFPF